MSDQPTQEWADEVKATTYTLQGRMVEAPFEQHPKWYSLTDEEKKQRAGTTYMRPEITWTKTR